MDGLRLWLHISKLAIRKSPAGIFTPVEHECPILPKPSPVPGNLFYIFSQFHKWQKVPHINLYIFATSDAKYVFYMFVGHFYFFCELPVYFLVWQNP